MSDTESFGLDPFQEEIIKRFAGVNGRFDELGQSIRDLRKEMHKRTAPITPLTGEIVFLGTRWRKEHLLPVTIALALAGIVARQAWSRIDVLEASVTAFETFAGIGERATSGDLARVARCVALRFREREIGVAAGETLADADPTLSDQITKCSNDLKDLLADLESR